MGLGLFVMGLVTEGMMGALCIAKVRGVFALLDVIL